MASRLSKYLFKDGTTTLSQDTFNPIWADIDGRIASLEGLQSSLQSAINVLSAAGVAQINAALAPLIANLNAQLAESQILLTTLQGLVSLDYGTLP